MRALVLCAGFGTRLGKLCKNTPKPLLSLGKMTILEHILGQLRQAQIQEVYINLHYLGATIVDRIGDGTAHGLKIRYSHEEAPLGTAGAIANIADKVGDRSLLVHYGDIVTTQPLGAFCEEHRRRSCDATILVHKRPGSNSFAYFGQGDQIVRFDERPQMVPMDAKNSFAFSGVCAIGTDCIQDIVEKRSRDLPSEIFPHLARHSRLRGVRLTSPRVAVDSPERLVRAREIVASSRLAS